MIDIPLDCEIHYDIDNRDIYLADINDGFVLLHHLRKHNRSSLTVLKFEGFFTHKSWDVLEPYINILCHRDMVIDICTDPWIVDIQDDGPWWLASRQYAEDVSRLRKWFPKAVIIHGDMRFRNHSQCDLRWYQTFWLFKREQFDQSISLQAADRCLRDHWLSCYNRRPMNHRAWWAATFQEQGWLTPENIFSFWGEDPYTKKRISPRSWYLDAVPDKEKQIFIGMSDRFPINTFSEFNWHNDTSNENPAYSNAYLNIVTESECDATWFSEKVMKPLSTGQMFVISGGVNSMRALKQLGFDVFDDIIDHGVYDQIPRWQDRVCAIRDLVASTRDWDWANIYAEIEQRRRHNVEWFWSQEFADLLTKEIKDIFL